MGISYLKYILLTLIIIINLFAFHIGIFTLPLLKAQVIAATAIILLLFVLKLELSNLLLLWFLLLMFREMGKIPVPVLPDFFPERAIWVIMFFFFFIEVMIKRMKIMKPSPAEVLMVAFSLLALSSMAMTGKLYSYEKGITLGNFLSGFGIPFSVFFIAKNVMYDERRVKKMFVFFLIIGFYLGITGIFEHYNLSQFVFPSVIMSSIKGSQVGLGAARGPFLNNAINGMVVLMILVIAVYMYYYFLKGKWRFIVGIDIMIMLVCLVFTLSRATWLAAIFVSILFFKHFPKTRKHVLFGGLIVISFLMLSYNYGMLKPYEKGLQSDMPFMELTTKKLMTTQPIYQRIGIMAASLSAIYEKPFLGHGYATFVDAVKPHFRRIKNMPYYEIPTNHNVWLGIAVELGLIGLIIYLAILAEVFRVSLRLYNNLPAGEFLGKGFVVLSWCFLVIYITEMQFAEIKYFYFPNSLFFAMAGIIHGIYQKRNETALLRL